VSAGFAGVNPRAFRKGQNLWLAYATEIAAPLLRVGARVKSRGEASPREKWRRGLILSHTHIGDLLYRTCSLPALREFLPQCEWTYLTSPGSAEALSGNPHIAHVMPAISGEDSWDLTTGAFEELRENQFDVVLCTNTLRHHPDLLLATNLGIPNRVGFVGKGMSGLINHPVELEFPQSYASYFRTMVAKVNHRAPDWDLRPRLYPSDEDRATAQALWISFGFSFSKPVIACSLRTRQAKGNWPEEVLLAILEVVRQKIEVDVVLCGGPEDTEDLAVLAESLPYKPRVLAGQCGLLAFASFLEKCAALLTLDSGPRHIGNAMGIPVFFARNLSHSQVEAGKYAANETDLAPPVEYLSNEETERIARAQPIDLLAAKILATISAAGSQA
jgi:heptosyltransferase-2